MSLLVSLPDDLSRSILSGWIDVEHWGLMDMAFSNKRFRLGFLACLQSISCKFLVPRKDRNANGWNVYEPIYEWIFKRGIRLTEIDLNDKMFLSKRSTNKSLPIRFEYVISIIACGGCADDQSTLSKFINACTNLSRLYVESKFDLTSLDPSILHGLTALNIESDLFRTVYTADCVSLLSEIATHCRNLQSFAFTPEISLPDVYLLQCFRLNPNLTELCLTINSQLLDGIIECFSKTLRKLKIKTNLPASTLSNISDICRQLICIEVFDLALDWKDSPRYVYRKQDRYLSLVIDYHDVTWIELWSQLHVIERLTITVNQLHNQPDIVRLFERFGSTLRSLSITSDEEYCESFTVANLLWLCPHLTRLEIDTNELDWATVLSNPNRLKEIIVLTPMKPNDVLLVLSRCDHLQYGEFGSVASLQLRNKNKPVVQCVTNAFRGYANSQRTNTWFKAGDGRTLEYTINIESIFH